MARKSVQLATLGLEILAILCDLRAFVYAFYVLFGVLSAHLIVTAVDFSITRAGTSKRD